jgi:predicted GIY-YIG superfamily endonuclease
MYEVFRDPYNAIAREKQIKAGSRRKKMELKRE